MDYSIVNESVFTWYEVCSETMSHDELRSVTSWADVTAAYKTHNSRLNELHKK